MTRAPAERPPKDGTSAGSGRSGTGQDQYFGRLLAFCACATVVLFAGGFATAPASDRQGLLPVAGLVGVVVALAIWFLKRGFARRLFVLAGVVLMALGAMVGAALPDGLDAAVILPLTGALSSSRSCEAGSSWPCSSSPSRRAWSARSSPTSWMG